MEYLDFELRIERGSGDEIALSVLQAPAGQVRGSTQLPDNWVQEHRELEDTLRGGAERPRTSSGGDRVMEKLGRSLFATLFPDDVRTLYELSREQVRAEGKGLRLKLRVLDPALSALPWELLYDPLRASHMALSTETPIVRYLELPRPDRPLRVTPPLRILAMCADPADAPALNVARERRLVEEAVEKGIERGDVWLDWVEAPTKSSLQDALRRPGYHVFHFIGHGEFDVAADEGVVALSDDYGGTDPISATQLATLLGDHATLRLVVLNMCEGARGGTRDLFSATAPILMKKGLPSVVAMQYEVSDPAAIQFSRRFYGSLATGMPVDASVAEARKAMSVLPDGGREWVVPVLHMRSPSGVLFDVQRGAVAIEHVDEGVPENGHAEEAIEAGSRRTVTILMTRLDTAVPSHERLDPEAGESLARRFLHDIGEAVQRHGGTIQPSADGTAMAIFGLPRAHDDDASRAIRASIEIGHVVRGLEPWIMKTWGLTLSVGIGLDTGEVLARTNSRGETTVMGDPVQLASRLQQAAAGGEILVGATTHRLVRDEVEAEAVEREGVTEIGSWRVISLLPTSASRRRSSVPMVGREIESGLLAQAFDRAERERSSHLFTIVGEAGVGKSRLIAEFVATVEQRATVLTGRCLSYGEGITYWPVCEMVKQASGISDVDQRGSALRKLEELCVDLPDADATVTRIAQLLGLEDSTTAPEETSLAIRTLLESLGGTRPLVLIFEDIHWAGGALLDLIEYLADWLRGAPVLMACLARRDLYDVRPGWGGGILNGTTITLESLSETQTNALIAEVLGQVSLPETVRRRVAASADGNPLFVEETLEMLIDTGALVKRDDTWVLDRDRSDIEIPPTIAALLSARIDQLDGGERDVFQRASVVGQEFFESAVIELSPTPRKPEVPGALATLVRRDLVRPFRSPLLVGEDGFRFRHLLLRDAAYRTLPKQQRAELHESFCDWIERVAGDRIAENEEVLGYHLEQAFRYREELGPPDRESDELAERANRWLASAARRATKRGDMRAAANLLGRATALPSSSGREELLVELGEARYHTGDLHGAQRAIEEASRIAEGHEDERIGGRATVVGLMVSALTDPEGWPEKAEREAARIIPTFERLGDEPALARVWSVLHNVHLIRGQYDEAAEASRVAADHAGRAGNEREEVEHLALWAATAAFGSTPVAEGLRRCEDILERAQAYPTVEAQVLLGLAALEAMDGDFDTARESIARSKALWESMGMMLSVASSAVQFSSFIENLAGDLQAAEAELRWGYTTLGEMGEESVRASLAGSLAGVLVDLGELEEASAFAVVAEESSASDDVDAHVLWRRARSRLLAREGDHAGANVLVREALAMAEETDDLDLIAGTNVVLAEVAASAQDADGEGTFLRAAAADYERKGNRVAAEKARKLIAGE